MARCRPVWTFQGPLTKVIVTHHPFDLPDETGDVDLVGRARAAMEVFSQCGVDLLLSGHFHVSQTGETSARHEIPGYSALVVQAGTATSTGALASLRTALSKQGFHPSVL